MKRISEAVLAEAEAWGELYREARQRLKAVGTFQAKARELGISTGALECIVNGKREARLAKKKEYYRDVEKARAYYRSIGQPFSLVGINRRR